MIEAVIRWSVTNRFFVLLAAVVLLAGGALALRTTRDPRRLAARWDRATDRPQRTQINLSLFTSL